MALHDRDYYRNSGPGAFRLTSLWVVLLALNVGVWILQLVLLRTDFHLEDYFACWPEEVFGKGHFWQLVTANFLHAPKEFYHILFNMFGLFIFGRELEPMYSRRDFLTLYLGAGVVAMLAHVVMGLANDSPNPAIGASGAVVGLAVLFALHFPTRELWFFGILPIQAWLLVVIWVGADILGSFDNQSGIAHFAHLGGAAFAFIYHFADLRFDSVRRRLGGRSRRKRRRPGDELIRTRTAPRQRKAETIQFPFPDNEGGAEPKERDAISARIDELLDKISRDGKESLTSDELEFLRTNSQHYRSQ